MIKTITSLLLGLMLAYVAPLYAEIYKCTNNKGEITFSQFKCAKQDKQETMQIEETPVLVTREPGTTPDGEEMIISTDALVGSWTNNYPIEPGISGIYDFSPTRLTVTTRFGLKNESTYTLKANKLIIHHKKGQWFKEDTDVEWELKSFDGKVLQVFYLTDFKLTKLP